HANSLRHLNFTVNINLLYDSHFHRLRAPPAVNMEGHVALRLCRQRDLKAAIPGETRVPNPSEAGCWQP
ncbi:hypothetical protein, partial [Ruegeria sp.]|uniref:hypothetical protein n=1 Tax=Ruegeria sp. TaxID=1879320 RepID=UPI00231377C9